MVRRSDLAPKQRLGVNLWSQTQRELPELRRALRRSTIARPRRGPFERIGDALIGRVRRERKVASLLLGIGGRRTDPPMKLRDPKPRNRRRDRGREQRMREADLVSGDADNTERLGSGEILVETCGVFQSRLQDRHSG